MGSASPASPICNEVCSWICLVDSERWDNLSRNADSAFRPAAVPACRTGRGAPPPAAVDPLAVCWHRHRPALRRRRQNRILRHRSKGSRKNMKEGVCTEWYRPPLGSQALESLANGSGMQGRLVESDAVELVAGRGVGAVHEGRCSGTGSRGPAAAPRSTCGTPRRTLRAAARTPPRLRRQQRHPLRNTYEGTRPSGQVGPLTSRRVHERVRRFRLAPKHMHLKQVDVVKRVADASLAKPQ